MQPRTEGTSAASLWHYNATLLTQAIGMIERLQAETHPGFDYGRTVGPHVRHIIEHYQTLISALIVPVRCVDYDARRRDLRMQTDPSVTLAALQRAIEQLRAYSTETGYGPATPLTTRLQTGLRGESEVTVPTTLGRELLFLASHTVHHYALIGHYCRAAGVEVGHEFGTAPATVAFQERQGTIGPAACV